MRRATRDLQTLTATGATSFTRRAIAANTAGALAVLGVLLGGCGAYLALAAANLDADELPTVPILDAAVIALGMPAIAYFAAWILARSEPSTIARQPIG